MGRWPGRRRYQTAGREIKWQDLIRSGFSFSHDCIVVDNDGGLYIIECKVPGVKQEMMTSIDRTRCIAEFVLQDVPGEALAEEHDKGRTAGQMLMLGRVLLAADTLGVAQMMLDKAVAYAQERKQFNRTIGSFQAIKHLCAEMAAELEPCRSLLWYAAHCFDAAPEEAPLMACHAKVHPSEVGQFVACTATEVHGGVGFTDELGLHYWFKRIGFNRQILGGPERVRNEAARMQG